AWRSQPRSARSRNRASEPGAGVPGNDDPSRRNQAMVIWTLAKKDLRLLLRDRRALIILIAMPFLFIAVLGMSLGEGFGQKPDDRLRVYFVDLDRGDYVESGGFPTKKWSQVVLDDLLQTAGIRLEKFDTREEAEQSIRDNKTAAVLIFGPDFSQ